MRWLASLWASRMCQCGIGAYPGYGDRCALCHRRMSDEQLDWFARYLMQITGREG